MGWIAPIWVGFVLSLGTIILLIAFAVEKQLKKPEYDQAFVESLIC